MITKSMTGFLREETKRQKEAIQKGLIDHNGHHDTNQSDPNMVHHGGYSEEYVSGSGAVEYIEPQVEGDPDDNLSNGLPARLPTEIMNRPPSVVADTLPEDEPLPDDNDEGEEDEEHFGDLMPDRVGPPKDDLNGQLLQNSGHHVANEMNQHIVIADVIADDNDNDSDHDPELGQTTETVKPPQSTEPTETFYYITENGDEAGPVTMDQIVEKYQSLDITDDTVIWEFGMTRAESKPIKENKRIYANLPKPPKRRIKSPEKKETKSSDVERTERIQPVVDSIDYAITNTPNKSKGCCIVL